MNNKTKRAGLLLATAFLAATISKADTNSTATSAAPQTNKARIEDLFPDTPVAKGKGFQVMRSQLDEATAGIRSSYAQRGHEISAMQFPLVEKQAYEQLVQVQLLKQEATAADKAKGKTEADQRFEMLRKQFPSEEAFNQRLKLMGITSAQLHQRLEEEASAEQVLLGKVTVTDDEIKQFYKDNPMRFEEPEKVRASHILISTSDPHSQAPLSAEDKAARRKMIDDVLKRARAGEDFGKLAQTYSDDPGSKEKGGELPAFGRNEMVKEFEAAAFSLQTNQISDVVTTKFGYHIIKLEEKIPAKKHTLNEPEIVKSVKNYLEGQKIEKILPDLIAKLKKDYDVQVVDSELKESLSAADEAMREAATQVPAAGGIPK